MGTKSIDIPLKTTKNQPPPREVVNTIEKLYDETIKGSSDIGLVDIGIATKDRHDSFMEVIKNLSNQTIASKFNLYLMNGDGTNRISHELKFRELPFNSIHLYHDSNHFSGGKWAKIYNDLFSFGGAEWLTYWSDDILLKSNRAFEKAIADWRYAACIFSPRITKGRKEDIVAFKDIPCINHGVIKRKVFDDLGGLNETYNFYYADFDLSLDIWANYTDFGINIINSPIFHKTTTKRVYDITNDRRSFHQKYDTVVRIGLDRTIINKLYKENIFLFVKIDEFSTKEAIQELERIVLRLKDYFYATKIVVRNKTDVECLAPYTVKEEFFGVLDNDKDIIRLLSKSYNNRLSLRCGHSFKYDIPYIMKELYEATGKPVYLN